MSIEKTQNYMGENKTILELAGELFQTTLIKVKKTDIEIQDAKRLLKAGTFISKDGKVVDGSTVSDDKVFGLVYRDVNFTYSNGTETVPVLIFGFVNTKSLPKQPSEEIKKALPMVQFL